MDIMSILTDRGFINGISGLVGGAWRAGDWYLNHKEETEEVKKLYVGRNLGIGLFAGLSTISINELAKTYIGFDIPSIAPIAFMYGMCAELVLVTLYDTIKTRVGDIIQSLK